jgi:hypothetical protein
VALYSFTPRKAPSSLASSELTSYSLGIVAPVVGVGVDTKTDTNLASIWEGPALHHVTSIIQGLKHEDLCLGLIGSTGTNFCVQLAAKYRNESHSLPINKFAALGLGLYISDNKTGCFIEPCLDGTDLDQGAVSRRMGLGMDF